MKLIYKNYPVISLAEIKAADPCKEEFSKLSELINSNEPFTANLAVKVVSSSGINWGIRSVLLPKLSIKNRQLFAVDCAFHVLDIYEKKYPGDLRIRICIEKTREYIEGKIELEELLVAKRNCYNVVAAAYAADAAFAAADAAAYAYAAVYAAADAAAYAADAYAAAAAAFAAASKQKEQLWQLRLIQSLLSSQ